ncbi:MAG: ABC transporter substrate-binding protein [Chloroflexi bacterium]|nr:ABC transporter substrate-binding protein [Chloroflexota bacterium]
MQGHGLRGIAILALWGLLVAACAPAAQQDQVQRQEAFEKKVEQVAGYKVPGGIQDLEGFPLFVTPDEKEKDPTKVKRGSSHRYLSLDPPHLDIGITSSCTVYNVNDMVYSKLVRAKVGPQADPFRIELDGDLAKSWEVSSDGLTYTFKLREGVKWQNVPPLNGRELLAEDVKFAFEDYQNSIQRATFENVARIEAPDKYTVKITLKDPNVDFVASIAAMAFIHPKEIKDQDGSWRQKAIGTGPFILETWTPKQGVKYRANPDFWEKDSAGGKLPYLDRAEMFVIPDSAAAAAAYRSGQLDVTPGFGKILDGQQLKKSDPDTIFMSNGSGLVRGNVNGFIMRLDRPPFNDLRVRKALSMGIDRMTMVDTLYQGGYAMSMGTSWIYMFDNMPTLKDWGPNYQYNPTEAKKLLAEAGYPSGLKVDLIDWYYRDPAETVIGLLKEVGITVNRREVDNPTQVTIITKGEYGDMTAVAWYIPGYEADSENYPFLHSKGAKNYGHYSNPEMDKLLDAQRKERDPAKRREILRKIWDLQLTDLPYIWTPTGRGINGWRPYVKNFRPHTYMGTLSCYTTGNNNRIIWHDK